MMGKYLGAAALVAAGLAASALAGSPDVTHTATCEGAGQTSSTPCHSGTVPLPPGGPEPVYPRDQPVGGANPFVPYGTNPFVPYGTWHGQAY